MPLLDQIKNSDKPYIIGVDEVGYGCIAGPLVICAVKAPKDWSYPGLNDSKKLSEKKRNKLSAELKNNKDITYSIVFYEANKIDSFAKNGQNVGNALRELYTQAIKNLDYQNSLIVIDGVHKLEEIEQISLPKADALLPSAMAASILAKVYRDNRMVELSKLYPVYGFDKHKGYGVKSHLQALNKHGPSAIHRFCYEPVKSMVK